MKKVVAICVAKLPSAATKYSPWSLQLAHAMLEHGTNTEIWGSGVAEIPILTFRRMISSRLLVSLVRKPLGDMAQVRIHRRPRTNMHVHFRRRCWAGKPRSENCPREVEFTRSHAFGHGSPSVYTRSGDPETEGLLALTLHLLFSSFLTPSIESTG